MRKTDWIYSFILSAGGSDGHSAKRHKRSGGGECEVGVAPARSAATAARQPVPVHSVPPISAQGRSQGQVMSASAALSNGEGAQVLPLITSRRNW